MRYFLIALLISSQAFSQERNLTIKVNDTTNIYNKVKLAFVKNDFIVKDDGNTDTLRTYSRDIVTIPGSAVVQAVIDGNQVTLSGIYGLKKINDWGYTATSKNYKPIIYYKGSKTWKLLERVANDIGGEVSK